MAAALFAAAALRLQAQPSVLTSQYGNMRQSYNSQESVLVSSSLQSVIAPAAFSGGPVLAIDKAPNGSTNQVFAQPLYVPGITVNSSFQQNCQDLTIGGQPACNMLVVAALGGGIYAFNAGDTAHSGGAGAGNLIWSRNTQVFPTGRGTTNYLWYDDCGSGASPGPSAPPNGIPYGVPFAGIVSTPVIDTTTTSGAYYMYVTSLCETNTGTGNQAWYIHKIDLTTGYDVVSPAPQITGYSFGSYQPDNFVNTSPPCPVADEYCIGFVPWETLQRPALLEAPVPAVTGVNPVIYVGFGFGETSEAGQPYHGWLFGYNASLSQQFAFATTTAGPVSLSGANNPNWPACNFNCSCTGTSCTTTKGPVATSCIAGNGSQSYQSSYNFCGHAAGLWMSGRGGAAATDGQNVSHAYFGIGNGSFQQNLNSGAGSLLNPITDWSESVVDFTISSSSISPAPTEYFTPYSNPVQAQLLGAAAGINPVPYTFEGMNQNDFDMSVGGILLYSDLAGNHRLVTVDKAGYGYVLKRGNLCGSPSSACYPNYPGGKAGFLTGDPGSLFTFGANLSQCQDLTAPDLCHRITSLAIYPDGSPNQYLYFWPHGETMTALQLSDASNQPGPGSISSSAGITVTGTSCTSGCPCSTGACFTHTVIPGDTIVAGGQSQTITQVASDTQLTVSPGFSPNLSGAGWQYAGYFINPIRDNTVAADNIFYPGASVVVTSNSGSGGTAWDLATVGVSGKARGSLYAYDAETLSLLWCNNGSGSPCDNSSTFTAARFALPTVVNGYVYIPTAGISSMTGSSCSATSPCSGIAVYSGH